MRFLSVCSGIEAASVAWHPLGWKPLAFAEIEAFPRAVLAHHYPDVPCHGDFTRLRDEAFIVDADVLVGGTPCQAFSVAGLRGSLSDERGNLTLEFVRLANAVDDLRRDAGRPPAYVLYENVPGVLAVSDNAFGSLLAGLVGHDAPIHPPPGRGWTYSGVVSGPRRVAAWRCLDAQYFGLAQRRKRVFVLAREHPGGWECADALLPIIDSLSGHPAPRREKGEGITPILEAGARTGISTTDLRAGSGIGEPGDPMFTLQAGKQHAVARCDTARQTRLDGESETFIPVAFDCKAGGETGFAIGQVAGALRGEGHGGGHAAIAFSCKDHEADAGDLAPTLRAMGHDGSHANAGGQLAVAFQSSQSGVREVQSHATLDANNGSRRHNGVVAGSIARRLTPRECERLQGFPDDYTLIPLSKGQRRAVEAEMADYYRRTSQEMSDDDLKRLAADGPRYKALGNSFAVPVVRWIGERIQAVEALRLSVPEAAA